MKIAKGGTDIWCPRCRDFRTCNAKNPYSYESEEGQQFFREDEPDIGWFRRLRICLTCDHEFLTAEIEEDLLDELISLRINMRRVLLNAEKHIASFEQAANTVKNLSLSLEGPRRMGSIVKRDDHA